MLMFNSALQMEKLLPPSLPALVHLRSLELHGCSRFEKLPASVAQRLASLTSFTWRFSQLTEIPPALSLITSLQELDLSENYHMELGPDSAIPLLALDHMTLLNLNNSTFNSSLEVMMDFVNRLPPYMAASLVEDEEDDAE